MTPSHFSVRSSAAASLLLELLPFINAIQFPLVLLERNFPPDRAVFYERVFGVRASYWNPNRITSGLPVVHPDGLQEVAEGQCGAARHQRLFVSTGEKAREFMSLSECVCAAHSATLFFFSPPTIKRL